jgi:hypothetical protein
MTMLRPRMRLTTILISVAFIGLVLALVARIRMAERRERALKVRLATSLSNQFSQEGMSRILTQLPQEGIRGNAARRFAYPRRAPIFSRGA